MTGIFSSSVAFVSPFVKRTNLASDEPVDCTRQQQQQKALRTFKNLSLLGN